MRGGKRPEFTKIYSCVLVNFGRNIDRTAIGHFRQVFLLQKFSIINSYYISLRSLLKFVVG
ncbi:hypothetical protein GCM10027185_61710 [Spirosoma pulveris]